MHLLFPSTTQEIQAGLGRKRRECQPHKVPVRIAPHLADAKDNRKRSKKWVFGKLICTEGMICYDDFNQPMFGRLDPRTGETKE
jgi:hypothetical protein